jgi:small GTP-binding protein
MADAYDHKEKFLLVGRPGSGKSSIVTKFSEDVFRSEYISTIGVDFNMRTVIIDGKPIQLQIWDTGDERLRSIIQAYYRGTAVRRALLGQLEVLSIRSCFASFSTVHHFCTLSKRAVR